MSTQVSRAAILWAIVRKDMLEYSRERFFVVITVIGILFYALAFWLLPSSVNESFAVGVRQTGMDAIFTEAMGDQSAGIEIVQFESIEALEAALGVGDAEPAVPLAIGLAFPDDFLQRVAAGQKTTVRVYVDANVPVEMRRAMTSFVREIAFALSGNPLPVAEPDREVIVLGEDRVGDQVPFREKIRPLFAILALVIETFALSSLIATEIQARTVTAVLVSPTRVSDFLAAKGILGTANGLRPSCASAADHRLIRQPTAHPAVRALVGRGAGDRLWTYRRCRRQGLHRNALLRHGLHDSADDSGDCGALPRYRRGVGEGLAFLWLDTSRGAGQRLQRRLAGGLAVSRHVAGMVPGRIRGGMGRVEAKSGNALGQDLRKCYKSNAMSFTRTVRPELVEGSKGERRRLNPLSSCGSGG